MASHQVAQGSQGSPEAPSHIVPSINKLGSAGFPTGKACKERAEPVAANNNADFKSFFILTSKDYA
ncbi:hypothetical protein CP8484711_0112 [Chlamydia psittaci 84-8471/1]|nr:hypothetical protein CP082626L3_0218 [Chlamydia psittaci 08-2626_L3]EPP35230.1 hypothetical protein CP8484711_0112 [Chlamydia psittaci 84-8471/1]